MTMLLLIASGLAATWMVAIIAQQRRIADTTRMDSRNEAALAEWEDDGGHTVAAPRPQ
jgi:hypothetical protein